MIFKREYEKLSRKVEDATRDWDADDDFEAFSNTKPNDHSTIVKVFQQFTKVERKKKSHTIILQKT